ECFESCPRRSTASISCRFAYSNRVDRLVDSGRVCGDWAGTLSAPEAGASRRMGSKLSHETMRDSILQQVLDRGMDGGDLREDDILQGRLVGAESIGGTDAPHRAIQVLEEAIGDEGRQLGAESE